MIKLSNECVSKCLLGNIESVHGDGRNFLGHFKRHFSLVTNIIRITHLQQKWVWVLSTRSIVLPSVLAQAGKHARLIGNSSRSNEWNWKEHTRPLKTCKTHVWLQILGLSSSVIWPGLNDSDGICDIKSMSFKMPHEYMFRPPPWILPPLVLSKTNRIEIAYYGEALVHIIGEGLSKISCPVGGCDYLMWWTVGKPLASASSDSQPMLALAATHSTKRWKETVEIVIIRHDYK